MTTLGLGENPRLWRHAEDASRLAQTEDDYPVSYSTDPEELRRENATLRARLRAKEEECDRWVRRWAGIA